MAPIGERAAEAARESTARSDPSSASEAAQERRRRIRRPQPGRSTTKRMNTGNSRMKTSALPTKCDQTKLAWFVDVKRFDQIITKSLHRLVARDRSARLCSVPESASL